MRARDIVIPASAGVLAGGISAVAGIGAVLGAPAVIGAAVGVGGLMAVGTALVTNWLRPAEPLLTTAYEDISESTEEKLEALLEKALELEDRIAALRRGLDDPTALDVLGDASSLIDRVQALTEFEAIQRLPVHSGEIEVLEGIVERYLPELLDASERSIGFLHTFAGSARDEAVANLQSVDAQLLILAESLESLERDVVRGVSRSLEVHAEFLRERFATQGVSPLIDL